MRKKQRIYRPILVCIFSIGLLLFNACSSTSKEKQTAKEKPLETTNDLRELLQRQKLSVLIENSALSYFVYKSRKMGFEYELLENFTKDLGVELDIKIVRNLDNIIQLLGEKEADVIACNYTITNDRKKDINFSIPYMRTSQVLVQRKPEGWEKLNKNELEKELIRDPADLAGKTIYVREKSSYFNRLENLQEELGDTIFLKTLDGSIIPERAIEMVSQGFIEYTVVDKNVALINASYFPNIDASLELSIQQKIAFGIKKDRILLRKRMDAWLEEFMKTPKYARIKNKYLNSPHTVSLAKNTTPTYSGRGISPYDQFIQKEAKKIHWDWRFIAAIIYKESNFKLDLESFAGAYGLMQFMPEVGPAYGVYPDSPPEIQIAGGVKKIAEDFKVWNTIKDSIQRMKFALATYNAGLGHVLDAQRLADKYEKDPLLWDDNVELFIRKLSDPEYYFDEVVRHGYLRGIETYTYVKDVFEIYNDYTLKF